MWMTGLQVLNVASQYAQWQEAGLETGEPGLESGAWLLGVNVSSGDLTIVANTMGALEMATVLKLCVGRE